MGISLPLNHATIGAVEAWEQEGSCGGGQTGDIGAKGTWTRTIRNGRGK